MEEVLERLETVNLATCARAEVNTTKGNTDMPKTSPTPCSLCGKPLNRRGIVWTPAPGIHTHMRPGCPKDFTRETHAALLPDCHEDHDLFEHLGTMHHGTFEPNGGVLRASKQHEGRR